MNLIRQYLRQKMTKGLNGKYDVEVLKKEIKDEVTHVLYDQTHRTPIVIPVINEIGLRGPVNGSGSNGGERNDRQKQRQPRPDQPAKPITMGDLPRRRFPAKQVPDTEANDTKARQAGDSRPY